LPDVPLMRDALPGFVSDVSYGIVVAAATPPEWVAFWSRALGEVVEQPAVKHRMEQLLWEPAYGSPEAYSEEILALRRVWEPLIRATGIRAGG
jgi:tripartite-type tricarboxylate transporter receptor subunit TctC